jgi:N-succinyldiaminopimelate aminotransferase
MPPAGLLQAAHAMGNTEYKHCVVFHSLSKRSNAPGLRSGFVAGDAEVLKHYALYRTYQGCAMSPPIQHASIAAWSDETHVRDNRASYRRKFSAVYPIVSEVLEVDMPPAGFYLWPETPVDDAEFARGLFAEGHVTVLPGSFLSRVSEGGVNPGARYVRIALVAPLDECVEAAHRINQFTKNLK